ncbi:MAG: 4-alpha-glucanotransferase [Oscillospiraceae bacterium]|nr:4-alpha-glucanotransferase [Oscillospiraceae bacterium]
MDMCLRHNFPRSSGVLLPVSMLHSPFGIGVIGAEAVEFIDFLSASGFHAWQILPLEHTGISFSPYKCVSAFAGEPMLIDPRMLLEMGLATPDDLTERAEGVSVDYVDYNVVRAKQLTLLRVAFSRLNDKPYSRFKPFWLDNYALYMAIKHRFGDIPWYDWPDEELRSHSLPAIRRAKEELSDEIAFNKFVQWLFHEQWARLKEYATRRGVSIIGDMPIYVAEDSAEVWSRRNLFDMDADGSFLAIGGVPPDYFNPDGQLWGNPVYNWSRMRKDGYKWWVSRVKAALERYDIIRLDHFRGFESYWRVPADADSAKEGKWTKGPGMSLFKALEEELGHLPLIAEDLGDITDDVKTLLKDSGFRGMRVMQFGFLGDESHLPHNFNKYSIAYTGTHDNTTMLAWMFELTPEVREQALSYLGFEGDWSVGGPNCAINKAWIRLLFTSTASLAIVPIQDMLGYGSDARTNIPGKPDGNWRFRIRGEALREIDAGFYAALNKTYRRDNSAAMDDNKLVLHNTMEE